MEDMMKTKNKILTAFCLLLATLLVAPVDGCSAVKKVRAKSSRSKSSKSSKKKNKLTVGDERASARATSRGTSASSSTSSTMDEGTEIINLTSSLLSCISAQCSGTIDFDKCFKTSNIDMYMAGNSDCQKYLNAASSDTVRTQAKAAVVSKVKGYLQEACTNAGGKVSGSTCKFDIYYYARSADGSHSKKSSAKSVSIGQTFTCTYASFGLSAQDLEYKLGTTTEDKVAYLKTTMDLVSGGLNTGLQVWSAMKNSKDIKRREQMHGDGYFMFNGKELTNICYEKEFNYGPSGYGKKGEIKQLVADGVCEESTMTTDSNGAWYCVNNERNLTKSCESSSDYKSYIKDGGNGSISECSTVENLKLTGPEKDKKCWVKISKATDISISEKLSELIRTKMDLDSMAQDAASAQSNINILNSVTVGAKQVAYADAINTMLGSNGSSTGTAYDYYVMKVKSDSYGNTDWKWRKNGSSDNNSCRLGGTYIGSESAAVSCVGADNVSSCYKLDGDTYGCVGRSKTETKEPSGDSGYITQGVNKLKEVSKINFRDEESEKVVKNYNAVKNAYTSNQNSLNTKKKELQELKDAQNGSISSIASTSTQTLMNTANTLITTKMNSDSKRGTMTGNCYLGDPANGNLFLTEGTSKKIDWKLFN